MVGNIISEKHIQCPYCFSNSCNWREELRFCRKNNWYNDSLLFCMDFRRFQLERYLENIYIELKHLNKTIPKNDSEKKYRKFINKKKRIFSSMLAEYEYDIHREIYNWGMSKQRPVVVNWENDDFEGLNN